MKIFWTLAFVLTLFAANSILCRLAIVETGMNAQSYTILRAVSASCVLCIITMFHKKNPLQEGNFIAAFALFTYMAGFSWAFIKLPAATGTLIIFFATQFTMLAYAVFRKEKFTLRQIIGMCIAFTGLLALVLPQATKPPLFSALAMFCAGSGWGVYCLCGKNSQNPIVNTAGNFIRCLPFALLLLPFAEIPNWQGALYACLAGGGASAIGYITWYSVVGKLSTSHASIVQLGSPIITPIGGILFLGESITIQFFISAIIILFGIFIVFTAKK